MKDTPHLHLKLNGKKFFFRPIFPSDKIFVKMGFRKLSPKSRYLRFFAHQNELTDEQLSFFTEVDGTNHVAWGVMDMTGFGMNPAGVGRFIRLREDPTIAEVAITVVDAYQGMGLGRTLIAILNVIGYQLGVRTFRYHVMPENMGIMESLNPISEQKKMKDRSVLMLDARLFPNHQAIDLSEKTEKFIEAMKRVEEKLKKWKPDML
jgi:hypothetical protein